MFKLNQIPATIVALANLATKIDSAKNIIDDMGAYMEVPYEYLAKSTFQKIAENPFDLSERGSILYYLDSKQRDFTELINDVTMLVVNYLQNQINEEVVNTKQFVTFETFKDMESNRYEQDKMPNDILFLQEYLNHFTNN